MVREHNEMAKLARAESHNLMTLDPTWARIRAEAEEVVRREPEMAGFMLATILNQDSLESAVAHRLGARLARDEVPGDLIRQTFEEMAAADAGIPPSLRADISAVVDRDPACNRALEPLLHFKGFHAIQTHRLAHWLWTTGRRDFALYLQSLSSSVFQVDIHPATRIGRGLFFDHATGVVIGETAVIEDNVSILHGVTLGGTGKSNEDRHPKIRHGVLIGAGAKILGNIEIGHCSRVAAGSVVLHDVAPNLTVAGVPARVVGASPCAEPSRSMDQIFYDAGI